MPGKKSQGRGAKNQFNAEQFTRPGLSADEVVEIKEAFDFFDVDGSGEVSVREFIEALRNYGFDTKNPEIYQMISDMDEDGRVIFNLRQRFDRL